jgi:hypothetical protein
VAAVSHPLVEGLLELLIRLDSANGARADPASGRPNCGPSSGPAAGRRTDGRAGRRTEQPARDRPSRGLLGRVYGGLERELPTFLLVSAHELCAGAPIRVDRRRPLRLGHAAGQRRMQSPRAKALFLIQDPPLVTLRSLG